MSLRVFLYCFFFVGMSLLSPVFDFSCSLSCIGQLLYTFDFFFGFFTIFIRNIP
jgi:hypothetical protein